MRYFYLQMRFTSDKFEFIWLGNNISTVWCPQSHKYENNYTILLSQIDNAFYYFIIMVFYSFPVKKVLRYMERPVVIFNDHCVRSLRPVNKNLCHVSSTPFSSNTRARAYRERERVRGTEIDRQSKDRLLWTPVQSGFYNNNRLDG